MRSIALGTGWPGLVSRFGLLLLFPVAAGCDSRGVKVSGKVLYNGDPVPGALVSFRPANPRHNMVTTKVDDDGTRGELDALLARLETDLPTCADAITRHYLSHLQAARQLALPTTERSR